MATATISNTGDINVTIESSTMKAEIGAGAGGGAGGGITSSEALALFHEWARANNADALPVDKIPTDIARVASVAKAGGTLLVPTSNILTWTSNTGVIGITTARNPEVGDLLAFNAPNTSLGTANVSISVNSQTALPLHTPEREDVPNSDITDSRLYVVLRSVTDYVLITEDAGSTGDDAATWAEEGNSDTIPLTKFPTEIARTEDVPSDGGTLLYQTQATTYQPLTGDLQVHLSREEEAGDVVVFIAPDTSASTLSSTVYIRVHHGELSDNRYELRGVDNEVIHPHNLRLERQYFAVRNEANYRMVGDEIVANWAEKNNASTIPVSKMHADIARVADVAKAGGTILYQSAVPSYNPGNGVLRVNTLRDSEQGDVIAFASPDTSAGTITEVRLANNTMDAASLHTFDAADIDHSELVEGRVYFALKRTDDYVMLSDHVDDEGSGGGGGLTQAQILALFSTWTRVGSTADIPEDRIPSAIARTADIPDEVADISTDGLPTADGTQVGKVFIDRIRKTASFLTEERIAQQDASGNFSAYPESETNGPYLGDFANDQAAVTHVTNADEDLNKFYWNFGQHAFRYWHKTEVTPGIFDYHFSVVTDTATWLAARESFDHSDSGTEVVWLGDAATDDELRDRIPFDIADASRAYGVRTSGTVGVRKIDGSDYTAPVNADTIYGYAGLGVLGESAVSRSTLDQELSDLKGGAPANRDTLGELSTALDGKVTNDDLGTAATESTAVAASRRAVAAAIAAIPSGGGGSGTAGNGEVTWTRSLLATAPNTARQTAVQVSLGEDIDANAYYQFVGNEGSSGLPTSMTGLVLGAHLLDDDMAPVQAAAPTAPSNGLDLKLSRGNNSTFNSYGHESLFVFRQAANSLWLVHSNNQTQMAYRVYKIVASAAVPQITDDDLDVGTPSNESTTAGASRQAIAEQFALESSQQQSESTPISRTLILWGRFASEPQLTDYPVVLWTGTEYGLTDPNWHELQSDTTGSDPLYMALATATRTGSVWSQTAWQVFPTDLPVQYSEDASSWHTTQTDNDDWLRFRHSEGNWSAPIYIGQQPTMTWTSVGGFHLNNAETADFAITPMDLSQCSELRVVCREFATWSDYSSEHWASVREAVMSTEDMQTVSETAPASVILNEPQNPIGCRFTNTGSFIGLGQVDVTGSAVRGPFCFSFAFAGPSGGLAERIRVIQRGVSWAWAKVDIYIR